MIAKFTRLEYEAFYLTIENLGFYESIKLGGVIKNSADSQSMEEK